jgi:hypothetical protein
MSPNTAESQDIAKKSPETQITDKATKIQAEDGPCATIADEEEDQFRNKSTDELKDHVNKLNNDSAALQIQHSETFREMRQKITDTRPPRRLVRPAFEPNATPTDPRMICRTKM